MRHWILRCILALLALPVWAASDAVRLTARETVTREFPGATTAFAVDPDIVEATAVGGELVLVGRRAGQTLVTIVMPGSVETLTVRVEPAPTHVMTYEGAGTARAGFIEGRYDSASRRFSTGLTMTFGEGEHTTYLRLYGIHERPGDGADGLTALPTASLEFRSPGRSLVLLDQYVEASPLTLDGIVVRGMHLRQGPLSLHAGVASATPWDDLLLPGKGDGVLGLSYRIDRGNGLRVVPAVLWLPDSDTKVPGVVSLGFERGAGEDPVQLKAELGWSDKPGVSFDLSSRTRQRQIWLTGAARPVGFAAPALARSAGSYLDGAWSEQLGERLTAGLSLSASRLDLADRRPEAASGRIELRHQTTERWSVTGGLGGSGYREAAAPTLRRSTLSFGGAYDEIAFGVAAVYRYQQISSASRDGHGGRVTMRGSRGGWRTSVFVDAQQQAPTLDLVFRERSDLARAYAELGFVANDPEEVVRQLRDNAALFAEHGVAVGTLRQDPLRLQGGLDVSWRNLGQRRTELGLRLVADDAQGVFGSRRNTLATLYASWRILRDTELGVSYVRWSTRREGSSDDDRSSFQLALRTTLSASRLFSRDGAAITGWVVRDDGATGVPDVRLPPLAGVEVVLDRWRRTRTDSDGRFTFEAPGPGEHRVEAVLPSQPGAYFTAPSAVTAAAGGETRFAMTFSAARLSGTIRSDAGLPLAGVRLRLEGADDATATTDSSGEYRFSARAGDARVAVIAESLPPGYALGELAPQSRRLAPGAPAVADFTVRAQRALEGIVSGTGGKPVTVTALEADRHVETDKDGRFLLRGLPAGPLTLIVGTPGGERRQVVEVPREPGSVTGVEIAVN